MTFTRHSEPKAAFRGRDGTTRHCTLENRQSLPYIRIALYHSSMITPTALATLERFGTALADPIRRQVLLLLTDGPSYPNDLLAHIDTSQPNLSNHLACLRGCGLVLSERQGRRVRYELASKELAHALTDLVSIELAVIDDHDHLGQS